VRGRWVYLLSNVPLNFNPGDPTLLGGEGCPRCGNGIVGRAMGVGVSRTLAVEVGRMHAAVGRQGRDYWWVRLPVELTLARCGDQELGVDWRV
jgi:hypothetical protein